MERCEMDVGRSGHGAVAEGGVGVVAASGAVGGDHGHPVVTAGGDVAARGPVHLGCHGVLASLDMFTLMASLSGLWPPACPLGACRCKKASTGQMVALYTGSANIHALEKPRTVKNMGVQGHILYS
uniref:Uncharacterized protein n=1 Tax=Triticum urartu TaxID=4572 RepID=A0A8R7PMD4_TRIUA